jgi:hypothetical protein
MSQLKDNFKTAIDAFNACQDAHDYSDLESYMHPDVKMTEVDWPYTPHDGRAQAIEYLCTTQPPYLPRFYPDYDQLQENPLNSDTETTASLDGPAIYQDCSTGNANGKPDRKVTLHYEFKRPDTKSPWLVMLASAK